MKQLQIKAILTTVIVLTLVSLSYLPVTQYLNSRVELVLVSVFDPARQKLERFFSWVNQLTELINIHERNAQLAAEKLALERRIIELEESLRDLDFITEQKVGKDDLVRVIGAAVTSSEGYLYIDQGSDMNVTLGDLVIEDRVLVGIVSEVHIGFSRVDLLTKTGSALPVQVGSEIGVLRGVVNLSLEIAELPPDAILRTGEFIESLPQARNPRIGGFIVGVLESKTSNEASGTQIWQVRSLTIPSRLDRLMLIKQK